MIIFKLYTYIFLNQDIFIHPVVWKCDSNSHLEVNKSKTLKVIGAVELELGTFIFLS